MLTAERERYVEQLQEDLDSLVTQLRAIPEVQKVFLFGSYAAGRRDLLTDLDLLVVMESPLAYVERNVALARRLAVASGGAGDAVSDGATDPMRNDPHDEGRRWLDQALVDLGWTKHLFEQGASYLVCFLAQQTAEKALKAFLYAQGEEVVLGHSVRRLCERAAVYDKRFAAYIDDWGILDSYYVPTRYPNGLPDDIPANVYNREAAEHALQLAEATVALVEAIFSEKGSEA